MRRSIVTLVAAPLLLLAVQPASAASGALHVKDLKGDANGVNSQSIGLPVPSTSTTPASVPGADIVALDVVTRYKAVKGKKVPRATAVTLSLAGPVQPGVSYGVTATAPATCDGDNKRVQLGYQDLVEQKDPLAICQRPLGGGTGDTIGFVEVDVARGKITWVLSMDQKPGEDLTGFAVSTSVFVLGVFDEFKPKGTFTFGR